MLIVQISDIHLAGWGKNAYGIAPMADNLALCVKHINQLNPLPEVVLVTGDITNSGAIEEYEQAASLLNKLDLPYYVIPGNHDNQSNFLSVFSGACCPISSLSKEQGFINYVVEDYELRLIAMDSTKPGEPGGEICSIRATWLDDQLSADSEKPTIIFIHHPPLKMGVKESNIDGFIGAEKLGEVIKKYTNIERILCGHIHLPAFVLWHDTVVSTSPSMGMQLALDLTLQQPSQFFLQPPAYQLHHWTADNNLISHIVNIRETEKSYLFEELSGQVSKK